MNTIKVIYDVASQTFEWDLSNVGSYYSDLMAGVRHPSGVQQFQDFKYGYELHMDGFVASQAEWPAEGVTYVSTDQDVLEVVRLSWVPDKQVKVVVWFENFGMRFSDERVFVVPKPAKPYADWVWSAESSLWVAPVPRPSDGMYVWVENSGWSPVPEVGS